MLLENTQVVQVAYVEPIETAPFCGPEGLEAEEMSHRDWLEWAWLRA